MYTIYIDDSGSSPDHKIVVASGIIIPASKLVRFEGEWNRFLEKEGIPDFHSSECLARNPHSEFADWSDARVQRVFARVRQITIKYAVKAFCIAIHKKDYDEVMPEDMRKRVGSYYTWALSSVLGLAYDWSVDHNAPMQYVFDTVGKEIKREIDEAMEYVEPDHPGHFVGHYLFGNRREVPGLQAADLFAWTCYQAARQSRFDHPIHALAEQSWDSYAAAYKENWLVAQSLNREGIELFVKQAYMTPVDLKIKEFKDKKKEARMPKRKTNVPPSP